MKTKIIFIVWLIAVVSSAACSNGLDKPQQAIIINKSLMVFDGKSYPRLKVRTLEDLKIIEFDVDPQIYSAVAVGDTLDDVHR